MDPRPVAATDDSRPAFGPWGWLVVVLAALPFLPGVFDAGWVYDDTRFVVINQHVTEPASWLAFFTDPETVDPRNPEAIVRPLRTLEFALDHALFGPSPSAFRLHSLLWHLLAAAGVFTLFRGLLGRALPAAFAALVWAVHPVQVESVTWIASRGDVAMGACFVWALVWARRSRGVDVALGVSLVLTALAALYKETAVVLPLCVFALRLVPDERPAPSLPRALLAAWPWFAVVTAYMVYRGAVADLGSDHIDTFVLGGSTAGTFATMFRGLGFYLLSILVPARQAMDWFLPPSTSLADPASIGWLVLHLVLIQRAIAWRVTHPQRTLSVALFYFALIPVANWPFWLGIPTAERFLYVPLLGFALAAGLVVRALPPRAAVRGVSAGIVVCLAVLSALRTQVWADDDTLWAHEITTHATARGEEWDGNRRQKRAHELLAKAREARDTGSQETFVAMARDEVRLAAAAYHRQIAIWRQIEGTDRPRSFPLLEPENNLAAIALSLDEPVHALRHAQRSVELVEALFVPEARPEQPYRLKARALLQIGRPIAAVLAMRTARERGYDTTSRAGSAWCEAAIWLLMERNAFAAAEEVNGWMGPDLRTMVSVRIESRKAGLRAAAERVDGGPMERSIAWARAGEWTKAHEWVLRMDGPAHDHFGWTREWTRIWFESRAEADSMREALEAYLRDAEEDPESALAALRCATTLGDRAAVDAALGRAREHGEATLRSAEEFMRSSGATCPVLDDAGSR